MKANWSWREGFRFAFAERFLSQEGALYLYEMSQAERLSSLLLRPTHRLVSYISKHIRKPTAIVLVTLGAALFSAVVFYNIPAFIILGKIFPSRTVRCLLFLYVEGNFFAAGCRAFARFGNRALIEVWKSGQLVSVLPGDKR